MAPENEEVITRSSHNRMRLQLSPKARNKIDQQTRRSWHFLHPWPGERPVWIKQCSIKINYDKGGRKRHSRKFFEKEVHLQSESMYLITEQLTDGTKAVLHARHW